MKEIQVNELKWITMLIALVASGLILGVMLRLQMVSGANDASRWNTVWSLTNGKGYTIDDAPYSTIDKVRRDGHFYSSKPPLMPTPSAYRHSGHPVFGQHCPVLRDDCSLWSLAGKDADRAGRASLLHRRRCFWHVFDFI